MTSRRAHGGSTLPAKGLVSEAGLGLQAGLGGGPLERFWSKAGLGQGGEI